LLRELESRTGHWHRALRRITGVDPAAPADRGNMDKTTAAWLRWAPSVASGAIAGLHTGRVADGLLVGACVLLVASILEHRRLPIDLRTEVA